MNCVPCSSCSSLRPSRSLSGTSGSLPRASSSPSLKPSPSVSATRGLVPISSSLPSGTLSPSVSGLLGLVPIASSVLSGTPSPSRSTWSPKCGRSNVVRQSSTGPSPSLTQWHSVFPVAPSQCMPTNSSSVAGKISNVTIWPRLILLVPPMVLSLQTVTQHSKPLTL